MEVSSKQVKTGQDFIRGSLCQNIHKSFFDINSNFLEK